jgi:hypothetical protein
VFKEFGAPLAIPDNGVPFARPNALYGLSRLSVWWLRLGIAIERIKPRNSQQNGRDEHARDAQSGNHQARRTKDLCLPVKCSLQRS